MTTTAIYQVTAKKHKLPSGPQDDLKVFIMI